MKVRVDSRLVVLSRSTSENECLGGFKTTATGLMAHLRLKCYMLKALGSTPSVSTNKTKTLGVSRWIKALCFQHDAVAAERFPDALRPLPSGCTLRILPMLKDSLLLKQQTVMSAVKMSLQNWSKR